MITEKRIEIISQSLCLDEIWVDPIGRRQYYFDKVENKDKETSEKWPFYTIENGNDHKSYYYQSHRVTTGVVRMPDDFAKIIRMVFALEMKLMEPRR